MAAAAGEQLAKKKAVTPVDVCLGIGWLSSSHVEAWRQGRVGSLRECLPVDDARLAQFLDCLGAWARAAGLEPAEADFVSATRDRRALLFTAGAGPEAERSWRTRWIPADLPPADRERIARRQEKPPDLVVVMPVKDWRCAAEAIARHTALRHTALRGSGRVGRSAAGRALDSEALTLAVVASVRHQDTDYDDLLMSGVPRDEARDQIRPAIDRILATWA